MNKRRKTLTKPIKPIPNKKRKKKLKRKTLFKRFFLILLCILFFTLCFFIFWGGKKVLDKTFQITQIYTENKTDYPEDEVIAVSELKVGDSWIFSDFKKAEKNIFKSLPYTQNIKIKREFWCKIKILIEKAEPFATIKDGDNFLILSKDYKILENKNELTQDLISIENIKIKSNEKERIITFENKQEEKILDKILKNFKYNNLSKIKTIDVSNPDELFVIYGAGIKILIGSTDDLDYKILTAKEILNSKIGSTEKGTLDLTSLKNNSRSYFTPERKS